jgi:hypothetical protein
MEPTARVAPGLVVFETGRKKAEERLCAIKRVAGLHTRPIPLTKVL